MRQYSFEKLEVWNQSRQLVKAIYKLTYHFPKEETFGLTSQIKRAVNSVPANLAEGSSRVTGKEQARFSEIAFSSLMEVLNHLRLAHDLGFIQEGHVNNLRPIIDTIAFSTNKLRQAQLRRRK